MLYQAALILALAGGALCENNHYEDEDIDLLQTFGQSLVWEQNTDELWSLEETVIYDEAVEQEGGCCLPDELQCFMGMMIAFQHRGSKLMMVGNNLGELGKLHGSLSGLSVLLHSYRAKPVQY